MKEKSNKIFASIAVVTLTAGMLYPTVTANTFNPERGENIETQLEYKADLQDLQINTIMALGEEEFLDDEFGGFAETTNSTELSLIGSIKIYKIAEDESMIQLNNVPQVELVDEIGNIVAETYIYNTEEMPELYYLTFENLQVQKDKEYFIRVTINDNGKTISKNATFYNLYENELEYVSPGVSCSMNVNAAQNVVKLQFNGKLDDITEEPQNLDETESAIQFEPFYISSNDKTMNENLTDEDLLSKANQLALDKIEKYLENPLDGLPTCYLRSYPTIENNVITVIIAFESKSAGADIGTAVFSKEYSIPVIPVETLSYANGVTIDYLEGISEKEKEKIVLDYYNDLYNNTLLVYNTISLYNDNGVGNVELISKSPLNIVNDKCDFRYRFYSNNSFGSFSITWVNEVTLNPVKYLKGDMDNNGIINGTDASIALDIYNKNNATEEELLIGDMDNDGVINGTDASMILDIYNKGI